MCTPMNGTRRLAFVALVLLSALHACRAVVEVRLDVGTVVGIEREVTAEFLGIPFARAGRWMPPHALIDDPLPSDPFDATRFGACCPQRDAGLYIPSVSEDCLNLNIFTPRHAGPSDRLPILFWIYGGGGTTGCSAQSLPPLYNGTNLVAGSREDVLVVTINYRLALFSRLFAPALTQEDPGYPTAGNYASLDIMAALQWVHAHIGRFGGDPSRITIFGESAGGNLSGELGAARGSSGLFARVISESATSFNFPAWSNVSAAAELGEQFIEAAGCANDDEHKAIECMRSIPYDELLQRTEALENRNPDSSIVDGWLYPMYPLTAIEKNIYSPVDFMIGKNVPDNWPLCNENPQADSSLAMRYTRINLPLWGLPAEYISTAQELYELDSCEANSGPRGCCRVVEGMMADYMMNCNAHRALRGLYENGQRNLFWFDIDCSPTCPPAHGSAQGVCQHTSEIAYVFGTVSNYQSAAAPTCAWDDSDFALSDLIIENWVSFAKGGQVSSPEWVRFTPGLGGRALLEQSADAAYVIGGSDKDARYCDFWDAVEREQDELRFS
eukprot:TRINITY_DN9034_c0_g1_i1.p1 TRINITY_DN9034_c0_g1~~TRINITY_DN9034_c0_g1_i1.p1  ORF type:complete len:556 (+),score=131.21 TRINITY_DN9034_c0_g1_i1:79-1746(+)